MTLNKEIKVFQTFASAHRQINNFGEGRIQDFATSGDIKYPAMWVDFVDDEILNERDLETPFTVYFIDRMQKGGMTYTEVLSDMREVALDLVRYIQSNYTSLIIKDRSATISKIGDPSQDDEVAGVVLKFNIKSFEGYDVCSIPFTNVPTVPANNDYVTIYDQNGNVITTISSGGNYIVTVLTGIQDTIDSNTSTIIDPIT